MDRVRNVLGRRVPLEFGRDFPCSLEFGVWSLEENWALFPIYPFKVQDFESCVPAVLLYFATPVLYHFPTPILPSNTQNLHHPQHIFADGFG